MLYSASNPELWRRPVVGAEEQVKAVLLYNTISCYSLQMTHSSPIDGFYGPFTDRGSHLLNQIQILDRVTHKGVLAMLLRECKRVVKLPSDMRLLRELSDVLASHVPAIKYFELVLPFGDDYDDLYRALDMRRREWVGGARMSDEVIDSPLAMHLLPSDRRIARLLCFMKSLTHLAIDLHCMTAASEIVLEIFLASAKPRLESLNITDGGIACHEDPQMLLRVLERFLVECPRLRVMRLCGNYELSTFGLGLLDSNIRLDSSVQYLHFERCNFMSRSSILLPRIVSHFKNIIDITFKNCRFVNLHVEHELKNLLKSDLDL